MGARRVALTAVALLAVVTTAGCNTASKDAAAVQPTVTTAASTSAAATPSVTPTPSPTPTPAPVLSLTQAQVTAALLTAADLGPGWEPDPSGVTDSSRSKGATYEPASCAAAAAALDGAGTPSSATAEAVFQSATTGQAIDETIDSVPGSTAADLTAFLQVVAGCPKFTETDTDGTILSMEMTTAPLSGLGDAAATVNLVVTSGGMTLPMAAVLVQAGEEEITVLGVGYDSPTGLLGIARTATSKVTGLHA